MDLLLSEERRDASLPWLPVSACLLAGFAAAVLTAPSGPARVGLAVALWRAAWTVLAAAAATAGVAYIALPAFSDCEPDRAPELAWRCGAVGAWLAPLVVLAQFGWSWALPPAAWCGWSAGRLLWQTGATEGRHKGLPFAIAAAVAGELACVAAVAGHLVPAVLLAAAGPFLLGATGPAVAPEPQTGPRRVWTGTQIALALAAVCLLILRVPQHGSGSGGGFPGGGGSGAGDRVVGTDLIASAILLADTRKVEPLRMPVPRARTSVASRRLKPPPTLRFSGVYWIFATPMMRPAADSLVVRDSPTHYNFTSSGRGFLIMQAHQQLPQAVDPRCCSALEVAVDNQDRDANSISLEARLMTSDVHGAARLSLGAQPVERRGESVVRFTIPGEPAVASFDRVVIDFHLRGYRFRRSANLAIESFTFVPR